MNPAPVQNSLVDLSLNLSFRIKFLLFLFFGCIVITSPAQDSITNNGRIMIPEQMIATATENSAYGHGKKRTWLIAGLNLAGYGGSLIALNNAWYKGYKKTPFHTFNDSKEWLQMDKVGHGWGAYNTARGSTAMWKWAGLSKNKAVWIGGLSSFAYLTTIEFFDARSAKWGWSWSDIGANFIGSGLFMGQEFLWNEQRLQFKFSFHSKKYNDLQLEKRADDLFGKAWYERMLKDYNAQTYWLSANLKSFFPESHLPAWLNIAIGYGADGMFGGFDNKWTDEAGNEITRFDLPRKRQIYLAPDIDFTKIKTNSKFLKTTFTVLNSFKFPSPTLMLDSKGKWKAYAIYF
ncbi:MAG: DUF2279 domain-containing protein [Chitinophagaceae bacterium]